ncbi:MAG: hypothetical protein K6G91_02765 [Kiritimatiellae bacterium]|nr:hypothetical protein [Kiritimatiellia bacterium]
MTKMFVALCLSTLSLAALAGTGFTVDGSRPHTIDLGACTVGGYAVFDVAGKTGEPLLTIEYACHPDGLSGKGDFQRETSARYLGEQFDLPVLPGNVNRHEIYRICRTGRFVAPLIQGQERYARFHVEPKDASVTISGFCISNAQVFAAEPLAGSFRCSDERLNKLWDASVWTCRLASFPNHDAWKCAGGRLMPRKLEKGEREGWCRTTAPDDGTLEIVYEFDANPHFPVGRFQVLAGIRRTEVVQDSTNALRTLSVPVRIGERFGFAVDKESWPMIDSVVLRNRKGEVVFRDDFDGPPDSWEFTRTRAYIADGAKRDRLIWSGDLWWAERNVFHAFAPDVPYMRDSIRMLAENQTPEGYVQACPFPENHRPLKSMELGPWESDEFAAWLVPVAWDYLLYTGDAKTLREVYPAIRRLMDYLSANREPDRLFRMRPGYSKSIGGDRLGSTSHITYMNLLLWMCYRDAASIAEELGECDAAGWRAEQAALADTIRRKLWNKEKSHFNISEKGPGFRVLDNAFAVATGFATPDEAKALMPRLTRIGIGKIQALILRGKFEYGYGSSAIATFERSNWLKVLEDSWPGAHCTTECMFMMTKSWWDESHPDTALAGQLSDYVLGLRPTEPGYRRWTFDPHPGGLAFAEGRVPTPRGVIEVCWERVGERLKCRIKEPGQPAREFSQAVPAEPDMSASDALRDGTLEIFDCFSDTSVKADSYAELVFDIGKVAGLREIRIVPTDNNVGWPGNLKVETSEDRDRWTTLREFDTLPRRETSIDARTVVGVTNARYLRISATKLGPAWLVNNFNLQFGKVTVLFE